MRSIVLHEENVDREAADSWATHDSAAYIAALKPARLELEPALIKMRARLKKSVTPRLEVDQIAAAKAIALRKSVLYQTLIRMWISEALVRELRQ
jgi:predicted DNA binding CopG/RHH family protein